MTIALMVCLVAVTAGFLILLDRKDKRAHAEREQDRKERADLLQRIQAPELAVVQHQIAESLEAPQPALESDDEWWKQDEDRRQAIAHIEAAENAQIFGQG